MPPMLRLSLLLLVLLAGCADAPVPEGLLGTWEEGEGRPGTVAFFDNGHLLVDPGDSGALGAIAGTFRVRGETIIAEVGPEPTRFTFREGRLVQEDGTVYRRRGD